MGCFAVGVHPAKDLSARLLAVQAVAAGKLRPQVFHGEDPEGGRSKENKGSQKLSPFDSGTRARLQPCRKMGLRNKGCRPWASAQGAQRMVSVRNICEVRKKRGSDGRRAQAFDGSAQEENAWPAAHAKELLAGCW